jgi:hypothetical protein
MTAVPADRDTVPEMFMTPVIELSACITVTLSEPVSWVDNRSLRYGKTTGR